MKSALLGSLVLAFVTAAQAVSSAPIKIGEINRYIFRLRPSTYMQAAMLVEEAAKICEGAPPG